MKTFPLNILSCIKGVVAFVTLLYSIVKKITVQTWVQSAASKQYFSFTLPHQPRTLEIFIYINPAQGFLPDRLQNTPKIPVFQSRTPKINRYFSCAQSPRRAKNDNFAR
jgi:hypothetical protein